MKATVYIKAKQTLISIGNFDENDQDVKLTIDWKALGLNPENVSIEAPEIKDFQNAGTFHINDIIPIKGKKGWLLIVREK